jgi:hypothetical protein
MMNLPNSLLLLEPAAIPSPDAALLIKLKEAAEIALLTPLLSVTHKTRLAPSEDPHDYLSMGTYWWPNPDTANGLPYLRRDGEKNPEGDQYDSTRLKKLVDAVFTLAWAGYFSGEIRFSQQAALLLKGWFIDKETRMNPHLDYGQFIPGVCDGRGIGIIDTSTVFPYLLDAITVVSASGALEPEDQADLNEWMKTYTRWLLTSLNGQDEAIQHNNHGTWYDAQLAALALFTGQPNLAAAVCLAARKLRIEAQIEPDGSQPHELARTRSLGYSTMNLEAFINLASLGQQVGVDLWHYEASDGRSIRKALDWLLPYSAGEKRWSRLQIAEFDRRAFYSLYRRSALALRESRYEAVLATLPPPPDAHWTLLLYPSFTQYRQ